MTIQPNTPITWQNGATASDPVFLRGAGFNRVLLPAGFEGATLTLQCAPGDGGAAPAASAFRTMKDDVGGTLTVAADPAAAVYCPPDFTEGAGWFRFLAAAPQSAARTAQLLHPVR